MRLVSVRSMRRIWTNESVIRETAWRYMTAERMCRLLRESAIHFASARQFDDKFEGAIQIVDRDAHLIPPLSLRLRYQDPFEELKRLTKICCWHLGDRESTTMWSLYAQNGKGIALKSTTTRILASIREYRLHASYGPEEVWFGRVRYENLRERIVYSGMLERFFMKHRAFESENEFRLAIPLRMAEQFAVSVPENGICVPVCVRTLVDRIVVGPEALPRDKNMVLQAAGAADLSERVMESELSGHAIYY